MFALGVELLMQRAVITRWDNRDEPEWPPHPDRVFMALVAAWGERGEDPAERIGLESLESLGSPAMRVSTNASRRASFASYVPSNDPQVPALRGREPTPGQIAEGIKVLPERRGKNSRSFPAIIPEDPTFHLIWPDVEPEDVHRDAIAALCSAVTYLGHSTTPIRMWVEVDPIDPNLVPTDGDARYRFRVFDSGRMDYLKKRFDAGLRPLPSLWQGYAELTSLRDDNVLDGPFDPGLIVLRQLAGRKFPLESGGMMAEAIRNTLMSRCGVNPPEWLSGHAADRSPSTRLRPAYLPLGFVGREHADGHLLGVAITIPRDFPEHEVEVLYDLLGRHDGTNLHDIEQGVPYLSLSFRNTVLDRSVGPLELALDESDERNPTRNLRPSTWIGPECRWATVTPLILPLFPRRELTPEDVIAKACIDAGYPLPVAVRASFAPLLQGVPHARSFHSKRRNGLPPRPLMHTEIQFAERIRGPVVIGAGRYIGFGVCRPIAEDTT